MTNLSIEFKVDFAKALLELEDIIRGEKSVLSRIVDVKETIVSGSNLVKGMRKRSIGKSGITGPLISALIQTPEDYAAAILFATRGKRYWYRDLSPHQDEYHKLRADRLGYFKAIIPSDNHPWDLVTYIISSEIEGLDFEDIKDVGAFIKNLDDATRFALIEDGVRVDLIIDGLEEDASEVVEQEQSKQIGRSGDESLDVGDVLERLYDGDLETNEWFLRMSAPQSQSALNPFEEHVPTELHDHDRSVPITEISGRGTENRARQRYAKEQSIDELVQPAIFRRSFPVSEQTPGSEQANTVTTREIVGVLPGVGSALERHSKLISNQLANGTNNEQSSAAPPISRPRPTLTPITEGYLKDMPDDGRLVLAAEMAGLKGRKKTDTAEAERLARFDVQRKMVQDLEDIKVGKLSTVWDRYGHPKAVRDLLGEEAYQTFVDDRLEAGIIANATAGLHLLQDAELFGIADGTTTLEAPYEKLVELMTPKVMGAAAERAREILALRKEKPSEAVLLSAELARRKAQFDAAFDANEAVDAEEMDAFLFYHETAHKEIGIAEPAIEMIPPSWARQVAERFQAPQTSNGKPTDRRAREAELKQHHTELQQSFGHRTDDVIAYSLARTASPEVLQSEQRRSQL